MRHPNRYPRPRARIPLVMPTAEAIACPYCERPIPNPAVQLDVEIEALKKERDDAIAAIEYAIALSTDSQTRPRFNDFAMRWLRDYVEEQPEAIATLARWRAERGTP